MFDDDGAHRAASKRLRTSSGFINLFRKLLETILFSGVREAGNRLKQFLCPLLFIYSEDLTKSMLYSSGVKVCLKG